VGNPTVVRLVRYVREQLAGVQEGDGDHARRQAGESSVIAAAAAAKAMAFGVGGEGGNDGDVGGGNGVGAEARGDGFVEAPWAEREGVRAVVGGPVEVQVGEQDGQQEGGGGEGGCQAIGEGGAAGLGRHGHIATDNALRVPPKEKNEFLEERVGRGEKPLGGHARPCGEDLGAQRAFLQSDAHVGPSIAQR